jgi:hypothetical protein
MDTGEPDQTMVAGDTMTMNAPTTKDASDGVFCSWVLPLGVGLAASALIGGGLALAWLVMR